MRKCQTCGMPLWMVWLTLGWPFQKRVKAFRDAEDCIDLLPRKLCDMIRAEARAETEKMMERANEWKRERQGSGTGLDRSTVV